MMIFKSEIWSRRYWSNAAVSARSGRPDPAAAGTVPIAAVRLRKVLNFAENAEEDCHNRQKNLIRRELQAKCLQFLTV